MLDICYNTNFNSCNNEKDWDPSIKIISICKLTHSFTNKIQQISSMKLIHTTKEKIKQVIFTIFSVARILRKSSIPTKFTLKDKGNNRCLRICGNGISLNNNKFEQEPTIDYMVVNKSVLSDKYCELKPKYYVLADPHFFTQPDGIDILSKINAKTNWELYLCVPYSKDNKKVITPNITNEKIQLQYYNNCDCKGASRIINYMYNHQLAMPSVQNVMVACIMLGIYMKFNLIELYGVDHTWTKYLSVHDDNLVYLEDPHFYDKEKIKEKIFTINNKPCPFYLALQLHARMFQSYWEIKNYIQKKNLPIKIINKTEGSFIDAFDR